MWALSLKSALNYLSSCHSQKSIYSSRTHIIHMIHHCYAYAAATFGRDTVCLCQLEQIRPQQCACTWAQRRWRCIHFCMFITIIWAENPLLFLPKIKLIKEVVSLCESGLIFFLFFLSPGRWIYGDVSDPAATTRLKQRGKRGEKLLFQPNKAFPASCSRIATGSGSVFFHSKHSGGCLVLRFHPPPSTPHLPLSCSFLNYS